MIAPGDALEHLGDLARVDFGDRLEVGEVRDRALVRDQREALDVEVVTLPACVGDLDFGRLEWDEVLLVRVGVEEGVRSVRSE